MLIIEEETLFQYKISKGYMKQGNPALSLLWFPAIQERLRNSCHKSHIINAIAIEKLYGILLGYSF